MVKVTKIGLDAGHGINTSGKRSPDDEREWTFNNSVLLACKARLLQYEGVEVLRLDDASGKTDVPLRTRTTLANKWGAHALVSIHHNALSSKWGNWGGVETLVQERTASAASKKIAQLVHARIVKSMGLRDRGVKEQNLHMTRQSNMPAILTEGGFMDSTTDIHALRDPSRLRAQGVAIADGLAEYFGLKLKAGATQNTTVSTPAPQKEDDKLELNERQRDDLALIYRLAREKGVFNSTEHEKDVLSGKMTVSKAIYLNALIASHVLNKG